MSEQTGSKNKWTDKKVFTTGEAATICKVSQQTIIRCFDSGRLGGFRVPGSKFRRIPRAELIKFMNSNEIPIDQLEAGAKRILVVDDDPEIVELFHDIFGRDERYSVESCGTGYEAGLLTESFKPHLLILDYMLPDINGNIVCKQVRERELQQDTRILFVSGVINQSEIDDLLDAGADDFIRKPFDLAHIQGRVAELLGV